MIHDPKFHETVLGHKLDKIRSWMDFYYPQEWKTDKAINLLCDIIADLESRIAELEDQNSARSTKKVN